MRLALVLCCAVLSGCAGSPANRSAAPVADTAETPAVGELSPRTLSPGACGLFLWDRMPPAKLVFFANSLTGRANIVLDGREREMAATEIGGETHLGHPSIQKYATDGYRVDLSFQAERSPTMLGGQKVTGGTLAIERSDGWRFVVPVAGLIGCQS